MPKKKPTIQAIAKEWLKLKSRQKAIEKKLGDLKKELEPYLNEKDDKSAELEGHKFSLLLSERESFRLKEAKEELDIRLLRPYITISAFSQIRTCPLGKE